MATSSKMEQNIRNYSKEIKTISNFVDAVRKTVGQYLGYTGNKGFINMIREIFQNSIDELQKDSSPCNYIWVFYDETSHEVTVQDNGRGIPFNDMIRVFTAEHTSSNYVKTPGEFSSGRHGVGSKVTNAVSEYFIVQSYILGEARYLKFIDGKPDGEPSVIPNKSNYQGTIITFKPSYEVMGEITVTCNEVMHLIETLLPLLKIGACIDFCGKTSNNEKIDKHYVNEDGIITDLINKTTSPLIKPVVYGMLRQDGRMKADIAFTYDSNDLMTENITGFSNFCPTIAGTHIDGFLEGITKYFREYMNKIYLNKSKLKIVNNDIKCGLKAIVAVSHLEPIFTGQAKEILSNDDMFWFVRELTLNHLAKWSKENPNDLQRLCKYYKDVAELRVKSDEGKIKLSQQYEASHLTGLPKKYIKPTGKPSDKLELIIVEGDSALGPAKNNRDNVRQGLFPIRGKMPNAFKTPVKKFLENEEVSGILNIIGCGYGKNFDISKCKWDKIIIGADADPDGAHIRTLVLKFMLMYCLPIITSGRFYSLVPPLYGITVKSKKLYFTEKLDFVKYIENKFSAQNIVSYENGFKMTPSEVIELLFKNMDYVSALEQVANTFAINPYLLEKCLNLRNESYTVFKKEIHRNYRFLNVDKKNDTIIISNLLDDKYQMVFFNQKLLDNCIHVLPYIDGPIKNVLLNNKLTSLYGLMKAFERFIPINSRYKGLGEMNGKELAESTLHTQANRTLMRYSIDDVKKEIEAIRLIESDKSVLLKDIKVTKFDID